MAEIPRVPVALTVRLPDGQLVVLHGQADLVSTDMDLDRRARWHTTIEWHGMSRTTLPADIPGVRLHDDNGIGGPLFHPEPLFRSELR